MIGLYLDIYIAGYSYSGYCKQSNLVNNLAQFYEVTAHVCGVFCVLIFRHISLGVLR